MGRARARPESALQRECALRRPLRGPGAGDVGQELRLGAAAGLVGPHALGESLGLAGQVGVTNAMPPSLTRRLLRTVRGAVLGNDTVGAKAGPAPRSSTGSRA